MPSSGDARARAKSSLLEAARNHECRPFVMELLGECIDFIDNECEPRSDEVERTNRIPDDLLVRMRQMGHFGFTMPKAHGGQDVHPFAKSRWRCHQVI